MSRIGVQASRHSMAVRIGAVSIVAQRDRYNAPALTIDRVASQFRRAAVFAPWAVHPPGVKFTLGGWSVRPQVSRDGFAVGRLWVEWFR